MAKQSRSRALEAKGQLGMFSVSEMTPLPATTWETPDLSALPDRLFGPVGIDLEGTDLGLRAGQGPGWAWPGGGQVCGYSVCADNCRVYLPINHAEGNVDPGQARRWLNHVLGDPRQPKIFANALYDLGWSAQDGVKIAYDPDTLVDVQLVEPLLDEHRLSYDLGAVARDRVGRGKDERDMIQAGRMYGLGETARAVKSRLAELPARFVAPYAIEDAVLPREIWEVQRPLVEAEGLGEICAVEHGLVPMYLDMRARGIRVNVDRVNKMRQRLSGEVAALVAEVKRMTGIAVEIWEARSLAKLLDELGVYYGLTPRSKEPQIGNETLERADHPACSMILQARQKDKLCGTFLEGQLLGQLHGDRVYGQVHPLKSDDGGAVTGRISMSNPNLLFIPARTKEGLEIRTMFEPERGDDWWKLDNSQQEVRLLVHFAVRAHLYEVSQGRYGLPSALEAKRRYHDDPNLDYHDMVSSMTGLPRKRAKSLNFAIIYGRGVKETAAELELSFEEAKALFQQHATKMPFAKETSNYCQRTVQARGFITTLLRRRQRFPLWEPDDWDLRDGRMLTLERAEDAWPGVPLTRARRHKALNALIQPSAADQTKKAMLDMWRDGCGKSVMIQVYDEFDLTTSDQKVVDRAAAIMRDAVPLEVPVKVDASRGATWGDAA